MALFAYPDRLNNLAAEAIGKFVSQLVQQVKFPQCTETEAYRLNYVQQTCIHLGKMIHCTLPVSLANEVTIRILRHVLLAYRDLIEYPCFRKYCEEIAPMVVTALLHPLVMRLECFEKNPHPTIIDRYKVWYSDLIFDSLRKLKKLRVLRLGSSNNYNEKRLNRDDFSEELEEFSYQYCEDEEIEALSKISTKLRRLDLSDSYLTDVSVDYISNFSCLEELNVSCALISQEGLTILLNRLSETELSDDKPCLCASKRLKCFGCHSPSPHHLNILGSKFPNIVSLSLRNVQCSLAPLKSLKHLIKLSLKLFLFSFVEELLRFVGKQILCLNLRDVHDTDLGLIGKTCPFLRCLHLSFINFVEFDQENREVKVFPNKYHVPEFYYVKCLELKLLDDNISQQILLRFSNVRKLFLSEGASQTLINILLQRRLLKYLEQLFLTESQNVDTVIQFYDNSAIITEIDYYSDKILVYSKLLA